VVVSATAAKNAETATDKELDGSVITLGDHRLRLHEPCMAGTHTGILQESDQNLIGIRERGPAFVPFFFLEN